MSVFACIAFSDVPTAQVVGPLSHLAMATVAMLSGSECVGYTRNWKGCKRKAKIFIVISGNKKHAAPCCMSCAVWHKDNCEGPVVLSSSKRSVQYIHECMVHSHGKLKMLEGLYVHGLEITSAPFTEFCRTWPEFRAMVEAAGDKGGALRGAVGGLRRDVDELKALEGEVEGLSRDVDELEALKGEVEGLRQDVDELKPNVHSRSLSGTTSSGDGMVVVNPAALGPPPQECEPVRENVASMLKAFS